MTLSNKFIYYYYYININKSTQQLNNSTTQHNK